MPRQYGYKTVGATTVSVPANTMRASLITVPRATAVTKLTRYLDGQDATPGGQLAVPVRPVVYDQNYNLVGYGDQLQLPVGVAGEWIDLLFTRLPGGLLVLPKGSYFVGIQVGGTGQVVRAKAAATGGSGISKADTYSDGPLATLTAPTTDTKLGSQYLTGADSYAPPDNEDEFFYGRLPFDQAQRVFSSTQPRPLSGRVVSLAWHGSATDPERGSFAIVQKDGALAALVGERVRMTAPGGKQIFAFVHNEADLGSDDISVPRRLFREFALLGNDRLDVVLETLE